MYNITGAHNQYTMHVPVSWFSTVYFTHVCHSGCVRYIHVLNCSDHLGCHFCISSNFIYSNLDCFSSPKIINGYLQKGMWLNNWKPIMPHLVVIPICSLEIPSSLLNTVYIIILAFYSWRILNRSNIFRKKICTIYIDIWIVQAQKTYHQSCFLKRVE